MNASGGCQFTYFHGLYVDTNIKQPGWTTAELAYWLLWRWTGWIPGLRPHGVTQLALSSESPIPGLSKGATLLYVDWSIPRLTYSRELPEAATVLNLDYLIRPASGHSDMWGPVRPWWRRLERIRLGGKSVNRSMFATVHRLMPEAPANLVRWELQQARPGWQCVADAGSRDLGNHWRSFCSGAHVGSRQQAH